MAVETTKAAASELEEAVEVVGTLTARSEADVKTEYSGTVVEVFVTQWVRVKAGTPLARLDSREIDAGGPGRPRHGAPGRGRRRSAPRASWSGR